jgi:hypothetical protein
MLGEAGFTSIEVARLDGDIVNSYIIAGQGIASQGIASQG